MEESFKIETTFIKAGAPVEEYKKNLRPNTRVSEWVVQL
jgi:hypothetical protein